MATVEQQAPKTSNGVAQGGDPDHPEISVFNPATGAQIGSVPELDAVAVAALAKRGRAAQVGWDAYGFEGRAHVLLRIAEVADGQRRSRD